MQVYELARLDDRFDVVLFLGVLYHLRYPLLALDLLAEKVERLLVLQTLTFPDEEVAEQPDDVPLQERERLIQPGWPKLAFVERLLAGDPTNWWAPNHAAVEAMLRSSGFEILARPGHELYVCGASGGPPSPDELAAATGR
jgi:tRNA (mo5U34)-methyltransferase